MLLELELFSPPIWDPVAPTTWSEGCISKGETIPMAILWGQN